VPLYEYVCPKCGTFERIRKFSDAPLSACPTCGGPVTKNVSAPAIQFKGAGWYVTDYAGKAKGGEGKGAEGAAESNANAPAAAKPAEAKAEAKPEKAKKTGKTEAK
jgi:putative FmdB family regulatory protein